MLFTPLCTNLPLCTSPQIFALLRDILHVRPLTSSSIISPPLLHLVQIPVDTPSVAWAWDGLFPGLWFRIPLRALVCVSCECCVLSGRGLCVMLIPRPEESYRVWCVWVWSWSLENEKVLAHWGLLRHKKLIFYEDTKLLILYVLYHPRTCHFLCQNISPIFLNFYKAGLHKRSTNLSHLKILGDRRVTWRKFDFNPLETKRICFI
jgi:hypothetical protein